MNKLIGIPALIFSLSVAYYFAIYLPKKNQENIDREIAMKQAMLEARSGCVLAAEQSYIDLWNNACHSQGLPNNCSLNAVTANSFDKNRQDNKETCFKLYPSN